MERYDIGILAVALIWASVILDRSPYFSRLLPFLRGGTGGCIVVLGASKPKE